jgi:hypothetical protein
VIPRNVNISTVHVREQSAPWVVLGLEVLESGGGSSEWHYVHTVTAPGRVATIQAVLSICHNFGEIVNCQRFFKQAMINARPLWLRWHVTISLCNRCSLVINVDTISVTSPVVVHDVLATWGSCGDLKEGGVKTASSKGSNVKLAE